VEVVASLSQSRTASAQCGLFTYKSVPVIFEPPCINARFVLRIPLKMMKKCDNLCKSDNLHLYLKRLILFQA